MQRFALSRFAPCRALLASFRQRRREHPKHQETGKKLLCGAKAQLRRLQGRAQESAQRFHHGRQIALRQREIRGSGHRDISRMLIGKKEEQRVARARPAVPLDYP